MLGVGNGWRMDRKPCARISVKCGQFFKCTQLVPGIGSRLEQSHDNEAGENIDHFWTVNGLPFHIEIHFSKSNRNTHAVLLFTFLTKLWTLRTWLTEWRNDRLLHCVLQVRKKICVWLTDSCSGSGCLCMFYVCKRTLNTGISHSAAKLFFYISPFQQAGSKYAFVYYWSYRPDGRVAIKSNRGDKCDPRAPCATIHCRAVSTCTPIYYLEIAMQNVYKYIFERV